METHPVNPPPGPVERPLELFHALRYLRINSRRLEHLAGLGLPLSGRRVLEVGAGIGDLTTFFVDRGCTVVSTEGRADNFELLARRFAREPRVHTRRVDLDPPPVDGPGGWEPPAAHLNRFDVVFCYGLLYHLSHPAAALDFIARRVDEHGLALIETIVSVDPQNRVFDCPEDPRRPGAATSGMGCYPTRRWLFEQLHARFEWVYATVNQPAYFEFPDDWSHPPADRASRAVFVASRRPLESAELTTELPDRHGRA